MAVYREKVLPHLINCACGMKAIARQRQNVVPQAYGTVLELGAGSGLNLPYYNKLRVDKVIGLEPSEGMRRKGQAAINNTAIAFEWLAGGCEHIPLENDSVDSAVLTYTLCTVTDPHKSLAEIARVLRPSGVLLFSEHGLSSETNVRKWQHRLNPIWKRLAGGCNLNRDISELVRSSSFKVEELNNGYVKGPKFATYQFWGRAINQL